MQILQKYFPETAHNRAIRAIILAVVLIIGVVKLPAQTTPPVGDTLILPPVNATDTTLSMVEADSGIRDKVIYFGKDSTVFDLTRKEVWLYGMGSRVEYGDIKVEGARIVFSFETMIARASGIPDSTGALVGRPVFTEGDNQFDQDSLVYHFKTSKGLSYGVHTAEGEAHLHSAVSKKQDNDWLHIRNGKFTTCDHPNPHFHFHLSRAIVIPDEKVVSGPLYLKVRKVPLPLALPFGFFPNRRTSTHGIILPGYGNGQRKGFFVQNLGYFLPLSEHWDTRMLFDVYTRGSWSVRNITNYKKRYRYSGGFNVSRTVNVNGMEQLPNFSRQVTFNLQWNHAQDPKARPNSRFNANVNVGSSQNFRNNLNSTQQDFLSGTFNSGLQWSKSFPGRPYSVAVNANHTQNTQTRQVQITLPSATMNISRINLLSGLFPNSPIGINGTVTMENFISEKEQNIRMDNLGALAGRMQNGIRMNSTASTSWKLGPYATINPNATAAGFVTFRQVLPVMDEDLRREVLDTIPRLGFAGTWNVGVSANSNIYGIWNLRQGKRLKALRHMIQPSAGVSYTPRLTTQRFGFYADDGEFIGYSPFDAARFRPSATRESASLNLGLNQNIEAKVRDRKSQKGEYKKVKIIEGYRLQTNYNFMADSLGWSNLAMSAFTTIAQNVTINYNSTHSFYDRDSLGNEINQGLWNSKRRFTRLEGANLALNFRFAGGQGGQDIEQAVRESQTLTQEEQTMLTRNQESFVDFNVPWSFTLGYNLRLSRTWNRSLQADTTTITQAVMFSGDVTLFKNWALSTMTGYDFEQNRFTTTSFSLHWLIHCWELSANVVPFGERRSYMVQLNIRSALLKDLKIQRRGNLGNEQLLY